MNLQSCSDTSSSLELSIVMPCLNEAETIENCLRKASVMMREYALRGEIIVADNGSTDGSPQIAAAQGARIVSVPLKGYGNALQYGIRAARGRYIIMGDSDDSYDFGECPRLLEPLRLGNELVMGNRFRGRIAPGAMPVLHRYVGNPVLSFLGRLLFGIPVGDFHCGLRGFSKAAYERWNPTAPGMEFASELVVKAALAQARITEVGVTLSPDGRSRPPHLRTWQDGWRHLHFLLTHSPRWLFGIPGLLLTVVGLSLFAWVLPTHRQVGHLRFDVHTLVVSLVLFIVGLQALALGLVGRIHAAYTGYRPFTAWIRRYTHFRTTTKGIFLGLTVSSLGVLGLLYGFWEWEAAAFGNLDPSQMLRILLPSSLLVLVGALLTMTSFFIGLIARGVHE